MNAKTKEELIAVYKVIEDNIKSLQKEQLDIKQHLISNYCPHKVGQKAKYTRIVTRNNGSIMCPDYQVVSKKEVTVVCVNITINDYDLNRFRYHFKSLKSDGSLSKHYVHIDDEFEWLDEYHLFSNNSK